MGDGSGRGPEEPVGSAAEEAVKLFGALAEWAREQGGDLGQGLSGLATQAASALSDVNDHLATGSQECQWCPVCRTIHVVRSTSPEVRAHLTSAAASLMQAAAGMLATHVSGSHPRPDRPVEHIDLEDDLGDWPEAPGTTADSTPDEEEDR